MVKDTKILNFWHGGKKIKNSVHYIALIMINKIEFQIGGIL